MPDITWQSSCKSAQITDDALLPYMFTFCASVFRDRLYNDYVATYVFMLAFVRTPSARARVCRCFWPKCHCCRVFMTALWLGYWCSYIAPAGLCTCVLAPRRAAAPHPNSLCYINSSYSVLSASRCIIASASASVGGLLAFRCRLAPAAARCGISTRCVVLITVQWKLASCYVPAEVQSHAGQSTQCRKFLPLMGNVIFSS